MRLEPANIQQIGDELAIVWNDGEESYFKLELLRRACPCAACGSGTTCCMFAGNALCVDGNDCPM